MGIEVYEILLMFSLIKNESMGGDCRLSGTVGVFIHQEQKYWDWRLSDSVDGFTNQERKYGDWM